MKHVDALVIGKGCEQAEGSRAGGQTKISLHQRQRNISYEITESQRAHPAVVIPVICSIGFVLLSFRVRNQPIKHYPVDFFANTYPIRW